MNSVTHWVGFVPERKVRCGNTHFYVSSVPILVGLDRNGNGSCSVPRLYLCDGEWLR